MEKKDRKKDIGVLYLFNCFHVTDNAEGPQGSWDNAKCSWVFQGPTDDNGKSLSLLVYLQNKKWNKENG